MIDGQLSSNLASVVVTLLSIVGSLSTLVVANPAVLVFFFPLLLLLLCFTLSSGAF